MRFLILLVALAACDSGGSRAPACEPTSNKDSRALPVVVPTPAPAPPPVSPEPPPSERTYSITMSALVLPLPAFEASRNRPNPYADDVLERLARGYPAEELSAIRDAAFAVVADPGSAKARFAEA
jgi:hypothetical protein